MKTSRPPVCISAYRRAYCLLYHFDRLVTASGLPPIRLHDLRHGAATLMLAAGADVKIVSDTLGHSDTRITRDIYQSVLPHVAKDAAEATARLVPLQCKTEAERTRNR